MDTQIICIADHKADQARYECELLRFLIRRPLPNRLNTGRLPKMLPRSYDDLPPKIGPHG